MENVSITVLKRSITTHKSKKRLFCLADLSLRRSHRSLRDKPDILRENKSSHLFSFVWLLYKGWFLLICSVRGTVHQKKKRKFWIIYSCSFKPTRVSFFHTEMCAGCSFPCNYNEKKLSNLNDSWFIQNGFMNWINQFRSDLFMNFHELSFCLWTLINGQKRTRVDFYFQWTMTVSVNSSYDFIFKWPYDL